MRRPAELSALHALLWRGLLLSGLAGSLAGCASRQAVLEPTPEPTLKTLAGRQAELPERVAVPTSTAQAIAAYQATLADPLSPTQRAHALRRLGDLEMDQQDQLAAGPEAAASSAASAASAPAAAKPLAELDYKVAVARYRRYLSNYPDAAGKDAVLYQLARAHDQVGETDESLKVLDQLVQEFPDSRFTDEAQFRRGEMLFTKRQYSAAEQAYAKVLSGGRDSPYRERAYYMRGWAQFKLARLEEALESFLTVLDGQLGEQPAEVPLEELPNLSRANRELVEDSMRVTSLILESLQGSAALAEHVQTDVRHHYEVRLYQHLAGLYLKQDRPKDAADTLSAFVQSHALDAQAPTLQSQVIEIYSSAGFANQALAAKKDYAQRYGSDSPYRAAQPEVWARLQAELHEYLVTLSRHYHALAQQQHQPADVDEAVQWYRTLLASFPQDEQAPQHRFLLAELLYENRRWAQAITEYEAVAYAQPTHARSTEAGYAAVLAHAELAKQAPEAERSALLRAGMASGLRFAQQFPQDGRAPAVLANVADTLYHLGDAAAATQAADALLAAHPNSPAATRRVAWLVKAHSSFEAQQFAAAEQAYTQVLALSPAQDANRAALVERVAVCVYRQGEAARDAGQLAQAAAHFERVAVVAPLSPVRVNAQFDAAAALLALKDWAGATRLLEDFRQRYPRHALAAELPPRLALAYTEQERWPQAAAEYERIAASTADANVARTAWWQVAELQEKAGSRSGAAKAWEAYLKRYPAPLDAAIEARHHLRQLAAAEGNKARELALQAEILQADQAGGSARTPRTRELGAKAALALAAPLMTSYQQVQLVEPLTKQLKLKKERMQAVLKAWEQAANYGAPEVATAATYQIAAVYQDFAKALLGSQRPKKLSALELEQYNLMLEEQADPFGEKATELHEINVSRTTQGLYDDWIKQSFAALRELRPARYRKAERSEEVIDAIR